MTLRGLDNTLTEIVRSDQLLPTLNLDIGRLLELYPIDLGRLPEIVFG